ncbi:MAG: hypothetical protein ABI920_19165, partial [Casimicrobiaceae bacterium]
MTRRADDPSSHPDPELGAAWSRVSRDEPPAALDDSIRAAARRAVHAAPHAPAPSPRAPAASRGWWPVAAAATLAAVVVGIVQMAPDERRHDELAGRMQGEPTVRPQAPSVPGAPVLPERAPPPVGPQASPPSGPPS